jgi:hypothetical protein
MAWRGRGGAQFIQAVNLYCVSSFPLYTGDDLDLQECFILTVKGKNISSLLILNTLTNYSKHYEKI